MIDVRVDVGDEPVADDEVREIVLGVLASEGVVAPAALDVSFVDEASIQALNAEHRGIDAVTDVLAFPIDGIAPLADGDPRAFGDVVICLAQARRQAGDADVSLGDELRSLLIHGVLHLLEYDHERDQGEMFARQDTLCGVLPVISAQ